MQLGGSFTHHFNFQVNERQHRAVGQGYTQGL